MKITNLNFVSKCCGAETYRNEPSKIYYCEKCGKKCKVKKQTKRFFFSVIEEFWNGQRQDLHGGRIEMYDDKSKSSYATEEFRFILPDEFYYKFREIFDGKFTNKPILIDFDTLDYDKNVGQKPKKISQARQKKKV